MTPAEALQDIREFENSKPLSAKGFPIFTYDEAIGRQHLQCDYQESIRMCVYTDGYTYQIDRPNQWAKRRPAGGKHGATA